MYNNKNRINNSSYIIKTYSIIVGLLSLVNYVVSPLLKKSCPLYIWKLQPNYFSIVYIFFIRQ